MSVIPKHAFKAEDLIESGRIPKSNVEDVKKWLTYRPQIPPMSEEQIVLFLIACNNVVEDTQSTIEKYFRCKFTNPEIFSNRDVDSKDMKFTFKVANIAVFPCRTKENYIVAMGALRDTTYYNFHIEQQVKTLFAIIDVMLHKDPPNGFIFIINLQGFPESLNQISTLELICVGLMHLTRLKLNVLRKFFYYLQEALPTQLKQVHILNASYIFEKILVIIKPFMKKELFDLLISHPVNTPMEEFFEKWVPASCMPSDFGGQLPTLDQLSENTQNDLRKLKPFLDMDEKQAKMYKEK